MNHWLAILVFIVLVLGLASLDETYVSGQKILILRVLFPSWRFFEDLGYSQKLYVCQSRDGQEFGPWEDLSKNPHQGLTSIFYNPDGNLRHACNSLVEHLVAEIESMEDVQLQEINESVSYQLVDRLVRYRLKQNKSEGVFFKFKISAVIADPQERVIEDLLISPVARV